MYSTDCEPHNDDAGGTYLHMWEGADTAQKLMVQRSRTIRRTMLNWGAVGEVVESGLVSWMGGVPLTLGMSSSLSSSIRSSCAVQKPVWSFRNACARWDKMKYSWHLTKER